MGIAMGFSVLATNRPQTFPWPLHESLAYTPILLVAIAAVDHRQLSPEASQLPAKRRDCLTFPDGCGFHPGRYRNIAGLRNSQALAFPFSIPIRTRLETFAVAISASNTVPPMDRLM
ncbi:MAG: hypothetical protein QM757_12230 [Paludibaculum sp.]